MHTNPRRAEYKRDSESVYAQLIWSHHHSDAWLVNFRRWSSIPDVHFCPKFRVLAVELNVFYKLVLFVTVYCIFQTRTMRIQWAILGMKMYIWYTAQSAKINKPRVTMFKGVRTINSQLKLTGIYLKLTLEQSFQNNFV